jgi:hypothetical protein
MIDSTLKRSYCRETTGRYFASKKDYAPTLPRKGKYQESSSFLKKRTKKLLPVLRLAALRARSLQVDFNLKRESPSKAKS